MGLASFSSTFHLSIPPKTPEKETSNKKQNNEHLEGAGHLPEHIHTHATLQHGPDILVGERIFENHKAYHPDGFGSTKIAQELLFANVIYSLHFVLHLAPWYL